MLLLLNNAISYLKYLKKYNLIYPLLDNLLEFHTKSSQNFIFSLLKFIL